MCKIVKGGYIFFSFSALLFFRRWISLRTEECLGEWAGLMNLTTHNSTPVVGSKRFPTSVDCSRLKKVIPKYFCPRAPGLHWRLLELSVWLRFSSGRLIPIHTFKFWDFMWHVCVLWGSDFCFLEQLWNCKIGKPSSWQICKQADQPSRKAPGSLQISCKS